MLAFELGSVPGVFRAENCGAAIGLVALTGLEPCVERAKLFRGRLLKTRAMKITGHKTEDIFERSSIKTIEGVKEALVKVGQYEEPKVVSIAEASAAR